MLPPALRRLLPGKLLSLGRRIRSALGRRRRKVFATLAAVLLLTVAATAVTRSWWALFGALLTVILLLAGTAFEVRRGQSALRNARAEQDALRDRLSAME